MNQTEEDFCILNYDDPVLNEFGHREDLRPQVVWFSSKEILDKGYYLNGGYICRKMDGPEEKIMGVNELQIIGNHNYENAMAAIAMAVCMEVPMGDIVRACKEFKAVEHRIEFVLERAGVKYYNDSKGTNTDASIRAIASMPGPVVLIAGGYDKGSPYDDWVQTFKGKVKYIILIGQTRDKIAECCKKYGFENVMYAETLDEAVKVAATYSDMGDCVLLSPACASWGMFKNYEERGKLFKEYVKAL